MARYRVVIGEIGNERGHILTTNARTERGARCVLSRQLAAYHGDGWGRIEVDTYDDGRWQRLGEGENDGNS